MQVEKPSRNEHVKKLCREVYTLAKPYLKTRYNDIHTLICYRYAIKLLTLESADESIVLPAILLHDVGWSKVPEELQLTAFGPKSSNKELNRIHETEGVKLASKILSQINYEKEKVKEILTIIDGHDSRLKAISINDMLVKDADKLFRYSFKGFIIAINRFEMTPEEYSLHLIQSFDDWFFTSSAKLLAKDSLDKIMTTLSKGGHE